MSVSHIVPANGNRPNWFIWSDKIALALAAIVAAGIGFAGFLFLLAAGKAGADHMFDSFGTADLERGLIVVALVWIALRGFDFALGGATAKMLAKLKPHAAAPNAYPAMRYAGSEPVLHDELPATLLTARRA